MQPDVAPVANGQAVAEPLMRQLVRDQPFRAPPAVAVVGPENRQRLRLDRDLERLVGDDDGVVGERVRPEQALEHLHHLRLPAEIVVELGAQPRRQDRVHRDRAAADPALLVVADLDRREVARHRLGLLVHPRRLAGLALLAHESAVRDRVEGVVRGDRDVVVRLGTRVVVAREPRRRAVGLARDDRALRQLLPADLAPGPADRLGNARVLHDHRQTAAGGDAARRCDASACRGCAGTSPARRSPTPSTPTAPGTGRG